MMLRWRNVLLAAVHVTSLLIVLTYVIQSSPHKHVQSGIRVLRSLSGSKIVATKTLLPNCTRNATVLVGPIPIEQNMKVISDFEERLKGTVNKGGWWTPFRCEPTVKVAIIVPFKKRQVQFKMFAHHMHPFLQKQNLHYRIIIVEQLADDPFNRAGLLNVGFLEAQKIDKFDCFIFSDVDLLPEDDRNYYGCLRSPMHLSPSIDKWNYAAIGLGHFGGVCSFRKKDFEAVNGMSNIYWGWGGEDDDLMMRIDSKKLKVTRPPHNIARYKMIKKEHYVDTTPYPGRKNLKVCALERMGIDGLNTIKYHVMEIVEEPLATFVKVELRKREYFV